MSTLANRYWDDPIVFLSISPEWAHQILDGEKRYEYRRQPPQLDPPFRMILYATSPSKEIVGAAWVTGTVEGPIEHLIENTVGLTHHEPEKIHDYFDGKVTGTALSIMGYREYEDPISLQEIRDVESDFSVPQNFFYVQPESGILGLLPHERGISYEQLDR